MAATDRWFVTFEKGGGWFWYVQDQQGQLVKNSEQTFTVLIDAFNDAAKHGCRGNPEITKPLAQSPFRETADTAS